MREEYDGLLKVDSFDDCTIGICYRINQEPIIAYSQERVIEKLSQDMTREEAIEYFEFNIIGAWVGDCTPCFIEEIT